MLKVLQYQLRRAQYRIKTQADESRSERTFQIGDMLFLKLQPYRQTSLANGPVPKLSPKFYSPFRVVDKVGKVAYQLDLPEDAQIHNIVHVSQLKRAIGHTGPTIALPVHSQKGPIFEPAAVLDRKMVKKGNRAETKLLIHWKNLSPAEATWEFAFELRRRFPSFSFEDNGS